jgi:putative membrane protein
VRLPAWNPHLDVWLVLGSVTAAYLIACRRQHAERGERTPGHQRRLFLGGMAMLALVSVWPIHDLAERYLYSAHMVQHMVFTFGAAPLLVAGSPVWALRKLLATPILGPVFRFAVRPLVALVSFNAILLFSHWPSVVNAAVTSELIHFGLHVLIVASAYVMWWPIVSPLPELPPINPPGQMLYLFFQSLAPTIPASFLTFGSHPLYTVYETFPRIWGVSALGDQMAAGLIMKIGGGLILWIVMASIFFRWAKREEREGWDALAMGRVEREVHAGLGR